MDKEFAGLTAIVTGAGSGIGLEVAKGLKLRGAKERWQITPPL
jgi:NAD(P)-dependent dehydrogenase (short-subunit alcohol dehydrogenase family)